MAIFVKKSLRWKQSEQRQEYLFLTWPMIKNHKYNFYKCTFKNYKSHSLHKNRLVGNLQVILNSHFLTSSSLFFKSWEIVIRVIILTLNLHEHVTVITVRYSVRRYDFKSYLPYFESIFLLPKRKIKLIELYPTRIICPILTCWFSDQRNT